MAGAHPPGHEHAPSAPDGTAAPEGTYGAGPSGHHHVDPHARCDSEGTGDDPDDDHHHDPGDAGWLHGLSHALRPHSHDHASHLQDPASRSAEGIRAVKISLVGLLATFVFQVGVVTISGSVALLSDTLHNLTDALTALPLWFAFALRRRGPSRTYTHGFGRAEDLAGVVVLIVVSMSAAVAGYESLRRLADPPEVEQLGWVVTAGIVGFLGNELVAVYRIRTGRRIGSAALIADGLHARTDGLTSLAVVGGAAGVSAGYPMADPIVGLLITVAILVILWSTAKEILRRLLDGVDPEIVSRIEDVALGVDCVEEVLEVRARWMGSELRAEVRVGLDCTVHDLVSAHEVTELVHHALLHEVPHVCSAIVHADPLTADGGDPHEGTAHHY